MKKTFYTRIKLFLFFNVVALAAFAQTCENSGIGTTVAPTSKLQIKGCTTGSGTSSLHIMNSANTPLFFVRDDGNVGIGTTTPEGPLQVGINSYKAVTGGLAGSPNLGFGTSYFGFNSSRQTNTWSTGTDLYNNGGGVIYGDLGGGIRFSTISTVPGTSGKTSGQTGITDATIAGNTKLYIRQDGNIAIGNLVAAAPLHISKGNYGAIYLGDNAPTGHHITHEPSDNSLVFWSGIMGAGTQRIKLDANGNLGITPYGTAINYKFQVNGPEVNPAAFQHGQVAAFQDNIGKYQTFFAVKAAGQSWSWLTKDNDNCIFWHDGSTNGGTSNGFVIAPWSSSAKGIRIDGPTGNLGIGVSVAKSRLEVAGSFAYKVVSKTISGAAGDETVILASNVITITLPPAADFNYSKFRAVFGRGCQWYSNPLCC